MKQIASMIMATAQLMKQSLSSVYSICWNDQQDKLAIMDPAMQQKNRACRDKLLPELTRLRQTQDETMTNVGIERDEVDFDIVGVDSWEERKAKEMKEAQSNGNFIDLCDSDDENENIKPAAAPNPVFAAARSKVKAEPGTQSSTNRLSWTKIFSPPPGAQRPNGFL